MAVVIGGGGRGGRNIRPGACYPPRSRGQEVINWGSGKEESVSSAFTRLTASANVTGLPSVAVPFRFSNNGPPLSFQIIGCPFGEVQILQVAQAYESATDWHTRAPLL